MAVVVDLEAYRQLLRIGLYMEWRQTLDSDLPYEADIYDLFIVTAEVEPLDAESVASLRAFFEIGMDTFYFTK